MDEDEEITLIGIWQGEMSKTGSKVHTPISLSISNSKNGQVSGIGNDGGNAAGEFDFQGTFQFSRLTFSKNFRVPGHASVDCVADLSIDGSHLTGSWSLTDGDGTWQAKKVIEDMSAAAPVIKIAQPLAEKILPELPPEKSPEKKCRLNRSPKLRRKPQCKPLSIHPPLRMIPQIAAKNVPDVVQQEADSRFVSIAATLMIYLERLILR